MDNYVVGREWMSEKEAGMIVYKEALDGVFSF